MAKLDPETLLERLSVANYVGCTKNQPKRLHLRPFRKKRLEHRKYIGLKYMIVDYLKSRLARAGHSCIKHPGVWESTILGWA